MSSVRFIDLFAGIGGLRLGFQQAFSSLGIQTECVFTSEIKPHAIRILKDNYEHQQFVGDITKVKNGEIPQFDFLLAGFPCQAFSFAGKRLGFADTRGTLFFEVERILSDKKPYGFILENVEGLVKHDLDPDDRQAPIGRTLSTMLNSLENLGYKVTWELLDSSFFGVPQSRKRVFIVGTLDTKVSLSGFGKHEVKLKDILQKGLPVQTTEFTQCLLRHYSASKLYGKSIKDKRGGDNNIHSWDIGLKGEVSEEQKELLDKLLKARRNKKWGEIKGIKWMDGMPLTLDEISTFYPRENLQSLLDDLVEKDYIKFEHPKDIVDVVMEDGSTKSMRMPRLDLPKGYNIVSGKLSFEFSKILDPDSIAPTIVATDVCKVGVVDGDGVRQLTIREGARLFGYPDSFRFDLDRKDDVFDLLGNTVVVPVVKAVATRVAHTYVESGYQTSKVGVEEHRREEEYVTKDTDESLLIRIN